MMNVFDLSAGMTGTKRLTDKTQRDDSPIRKIRAEVKKSPAITPNFAEENIVSGEVPRIPPKRQKGTPMKALLDKEMSKGTEPRLKQTSIVAKLMGLEDPPNPSPIQRPANPLTRNSSDNNNNNRPNSNTHKTQQRANRRARHGRHSFDEALEYKDVYEVEENPNNGGGRIGDDFDSRMDLVRRKFAEAKRFATDERMFRTHEFQDALDVLSSNRDLFLKFLEEPGTAPPPARTKRITVLKPVKSVGTETTGTAGSRRMISRQDLCDHNPDRRLSDHNNTSHPTRIVVLKPNTAGDGWHRRDESLISSSICSTNGYGGDESSLYNPSDNGFLEEDTGTGNCSDSEVLSPYSHKSWGYATGTRLGSPFSVSSLNTRDVMFSPESSVIKEAKKRLSERWALVVSDEIGTITVPAVPRSSSTLGEMLAVQELNKEKGMVDRERDDLSSRALSRSKSLPVSSSLFENLNLDANSKGSEVDNKVNSNGKGKSSSFKGKVSSFFFSRNKKPEKAKTGTDTGSLDHRDTLPVTSACTATAPDAEIEEGCSTSIGALFKHGLSIENPHSSSESLDRLLRPTRDQPSPTSVLDVTFDESSGTELDSSHPSLTSYQQPPLSRSSAIESVARTLSWDEKCFATPKKPPEQVLKTNSTTNADEQEHYSFVENLLSSSGFGTQRTRTMFSEWHSLESPLNPTLLDKFLDPKEEAAKCRERRSNQRLLFDCVNLALVQIGCHVVKNSYPWCTRPCDVLRDGFVTSEVWRIVREFFSNEGKFVLVEREYNTSLIVERIVKKELREKEWIESMQIEEVDEISQEIGGFVLDDLVGEALAEFAVLCS